jgi:hypothetical protein
MSTGFAVALAFFDIFNNWGTESVILWQVISIIEEVANGVWLVLQLNDDYFEPQFSTGLKVQPPKVEDTGPLTEGLSADLNDRGIPTRQCRLGMTSARV